MRDITRPGISLAYRLRRGDGTLIKARQRVADMHCLANSACLRSDSMPLPYERLMLGNWLEQTFRRCGARLPVWPAHETDERGRT